MGPRRSGVGSASGSTAVACTSDSTSLETDGPTADDAHGAFGRCGSASAPAAPTRGSSSPSEHHVAAAPKNNRRISLTPGKNRRLPFCLSLCGATRHVGARRYARFSPANRFGPLPRSNHSRPFITGGLSPANRGQTEGGHRPEKHPQHPAAGGTLGTARTIAGVNRRRCLEMGRYVPIVVDAHHKL